MRLLLLCALGCVLSGCAWSPEQLARRYEGCQRAANESGRPFAVINAQARCRGVSQSEVATWDSAKGPLFLPASRSPASAAPAPQPVTQPVQVPAPDKAAQPRLITADPEPLRPQVVADLPSTAPPSAAAVFKTAEQSVYVLYAAASANDVLTGTGIVQGSAVALTPHLALTNCHVVGDKALHFLTRGESVHEAVVVYRNPDADLCAVESRSGQLRPIAGMRSFSGLSIGERVYSIGSPGGLENTLGEGIISGLRGKRLIQTSAPISHGSSGGGLFDAAGYLIGITTFNMVDAQNLNFAVSAEAYYQRSR